ncbi:MAG: tRNA preQ1(34) S-adenosylmethionine ribosyltransferase-isomerase QueA, partial [Planctomycetota bacterium]
MRRDELNYELPPELIAQTPANPRDSARLLVLHRSDGRIEHRVFRDLPELLRPGDCLVRNVTRVIPARFFCRRPTGGRVEALFLRETDAGWRVLLRPSARLKVGQRLTIENARETIELRDRLERGE